METSAEIRNLKGQAIEMLADLRAQNEQVWTLLRPYLPEGAANETVKLGQVQQTIAKLRGYKCWQDLLADK